MTRLPAFAEAYEKQIDQEAEYGSISFHERLMLLVDADYEYQKIDQECEVF